MHAILSADVEGYSSWAHTSNEVPLPLTVPFGRVVRGERVVDLWRNSRNVIQLVVSSGVRPIIPRELLGTMSRGEDNVRMALTS